jgi:hypothetical protein
MDWRMKQDLDNYLTGHWGEDRLRQEALPRIPTMDECRWHNGVCYHPDCDEGYPCWAGGRTKAEAYGYMLVHFYILECSDLDESQAKALYAQICKAREAVR